MSANARKSRPGGKMPRKRTQRATSNIFAMFDQDQIAEFKEAFNMIDQNGDGTIDRDDLKDMLASLGKEASESELDEMLNPISGPLNFTMFLTLFGERLAGTDPEDVIKNAFSCFDQNGDGFIHEDYLREVLTSYGEQRFTQDQVDELFRDAPMGREGQFDYVEFARMLKHGRKDDENASTV